MRRRKIVTLTTIDRGEVAFRFWLRTRRVGSCVEWQGQCDTDGYGKFSIFHGSYRAHRIAYFLYYGIDPGDSLVLHRCDNPRCVNPRHLILGDQRQNIRDMDDRGRRGKVYLKGEQSGRAILSEKDVLAIRASNKTTAELTHLLGVSRGCIDDARSGRNWRHLNRASTD